MTQPYTTNLCTNPSFEIDLTGYTALAGTALSQLDSALFGQFSMQVVTDGSVPGEGFIGPEVLVPYVTTGSISLYIFGETGDLTVSAVAAPNGTVLASTNITLAGGNYQQVVLNGLPLLEGQEMYVLVQTTTAQALTFLVDGVQYEPESPAHPYIDGNQPWCTWAGTPGLSSSSQQYQNMTGAFGGMFLDGSCAMVIEGEVFQTGGAVGTMTLTGVDTADTVVNPVAALTDFAIFTPADPDPAQTYASWNNAGTSTGQTVYNRNYALVYPPQDYPVSGGGYLWHKAAYMAVGYDFKAVPATFQQNLTNAMVETMPVAPGTTPVPTTYRTPRTIRTTIKPTRLNFCPNPSFETSTAGWYGIGSATLAQDSSRAVAGTYSMKVTVHASGDGCAIAIPDLILGDTYIVSASVQGGPGLLDVSMSCSGSSSSSADQGIPYGGDALLGIGYGGGPYGGIESGTTDMPTGQWFLPNCVFTAQQSTVLLSFQSLPGSDISYPTEFWIDAVLLEVGETLGEYFDGGFGTDYSWETGGTANLTRSYYYERVQVAAGAVGNVLAQHTPLGISADAPLFSTPYTQ